MITTKSIQALKSLKTDACTLETMEARYQKIASDSQYDKHAFRFSENKQCSIFLANVNLENYFGGYGSSSVGSIFRLSSNETEIKKHFLAAINKHRELILKTMSTLMNESANKLKAEAEKELNALRSLIDEPINYETEKVK